MTMKEEKYAELFDAFAKAPIEEFLKLLFKGISPEVRRQLVLEDVSYHRLSAELVTLEAWMCMVPVESNRWIWVRVECGRDGAVQEQFFTKDSYRQQALGSLEECIEYYNNKEDKNE